MRDESQRDERVMTLVAEVLGRPAETRESYLRSACDDPELIAEVEERVRWEQKMEGFLSQNVVQVFELLDRPFEPGDLVAGRFRILAEIGRGGMGVVYDVLDEKLERRIAIKAALRGHDSRLPPEARAAREVSHFNVCKVHELHSAPTPDGAVEFLTMELVEGETLSERLRRAGPLPPPEARNIALQICAGLAQAHRQGVVHGDLKCGNVILADSPAGTRAVITDFGLAATFSSSGDEAKMPFRAGSFDYMAPEIFAGSPVSVASDIYALGVLFHVMLTGKTPASGEDRPTHENTTLTLPNGAYRPQRRDRLPQPWNAIVDRCLQGVPGERFHSVEEVIADLQAPAKQRKWLWAIPAAAAVLAVAGWYFRPRPTDSVRLAVLPVTVEGNAIPAAAGLGVEVADRFSNARRGFVVIPPGEAQRNGVDTVDKARTVLAATHVLRTRLRNTGGPVTLEASVIEVDSSHVINDLKGSYGPSDISLIAKAVTATITRAFRLRSGVPTEILAVSAYPSYAQGLFLLRRDDISADEAIPFLRKAIELDPHSALAQAALATAELQKFERHFGPEWLTNAADSVAKAQSLNPDSPPVLLASGSLNLEHGWYEKAAQDFSRAVELAPQNPDGWIRLAGAYRRLNRPGDAIATYQRALRAQPEYYVVYLEFGAFYYFRGQFLEAEPLFRHLTRIAPDLPRGHTLLGITLEQELRYSEAEKELKASLQIQPTELAFTNLGALYYQQGRYGDAVTYFEKSLVSGPESALRVGNLGEAYRHLDRDRDAKQAYHKAQSLAESEVLGNPRDASARALLAYLCARLGDSKRAEFEIAQAVGLEDGDTRVLRLAALTYETLGDRAKTLAIAREVSMPVLNELNHQPDVEGLQKDPDFQQILKDKLAQK